MLSLSLSISPFVSRPLCSSESIPSCRPASPCTSWYPIVCPKCCSSAPPLPQGAAKALPGSAGSAAPPQRQLLHGGSGSERSRQCHRVTVKLQAVGFWLQTSGVWGVWCKIGVAQQGSSTPGFTPRRFSGAESKAGALLQRDGTGCTCQEEQENPGQAAHLRLGLPTLLSRLSACGLQAAANLTRPCHVHGDAWRHGSALQRSAASTGAGGEVPLGPHGAGGANSARGGSASLQQLKAGCGAAGAEERCGQPGLVDFVTSLLFARTEPLPPHAAASKPLGLKVFVAKVGRWGSKEPRLPNHNRKAGQGWGTRVASRLQSAAL